MKFSRINVFLVLVLLILITWFFWCTKSTFICNENECHILNFNMFNVQISKKSIVPDNIIGFGYLNYERYGGRGGSDNYYVVIYLNNSNIYKVPKSFGYDCNSAKSMAIYLEDAIKKKPLDINIDF